MCIFTGRREVWHLFGCSLYCTADCVIKQLVLYGRSVRESQQNKTPERKSLWRTGPQLGYNRWVSSMFKRCGEDTACNHVGDVKHLCIVFVNLFMQFLWTTVDSSRNFEKCPSLSRILAPSLAFSILSLPIFDRTCHMGPPIFK